MRCYCKIILHGTHGSNHCYDLVTDGGVEHGLKVKGIGSMGANQETKKLLKKVGMRSRVE